MNEDIVIVMVVMEWTSVTVRERETIKREFYGFLSFNIVVLKKQMRCTII